MKLVQKILQIKSKWERWGGDFPSNSEAKSGQNLPLLAQSQVSKSLDASLHSAELSAAFPWTPTEFGAEGIVS